MVQSRAFLPLAYDRPLGESKLADFIAACQKQQVADIVDLINKNNCHDLLYAIFAGSPYLSRLLLNNAEFAAKLLSAPLEELFGDIIADLQQRLPQVTETGHVKKILRQAKARVALTISFADLSGKWPLQRITRRLTLFAETCVSLVVSHLLRAEMIKGNLAVPEHLGSVPAQDLPATADLAKNTGYVVLAMGKMGGYELNYSSDIDLIVLFDNEIIRYTGRRTAQDLFIKLTRNLVKIMQERTADGYVFRTDLRLRPDPGATAVALSMAGAEIYYQSMGLNWERAAMIKARPVAGDLKAGYGFLSRIKGFVWRKHLDYAALEDIYAIKKLIHHHHGHNKFCFAGYDVKLGHGGIREIEFYAQIFQLISGGREPELRQPATCDALNALVENHKLAPEDNRKLQEAYIYYRTLEHRLQMINDDQTHMMPDHAPELDRITAFMGYQGRADFEHDLHRHRQNVHSLFTDLLKDAHQEEEEEAPLLAFPEDRYHEATLEQIESCGYESPKAIYDLVQSWLRGRYRACRTARARKLLQGLIPEILLNFGKLASPDISFKKFDEFLSRLPSGVQLFSFIKAQPWLLELLAEIIGIAPKLSDQLAKRPLLLDAVLNQDFFETHFTTETLKGHLEGQLEPAKDFQDILDVIRKWTNEHKFQVGVQILRNRTCARVAGHNLSLVADVVLEVMLAEVKKEFARKHGGLRGGQFAVLALGKLGGRELTTTSDLDLVFIYDTPDKSQMSDGVKPLTVNHYFARLSQQYINALTAMTGEGRLYEIDMRLRPSGNAGPIAVTLESFEEYQETNAWTWEHLALTRGRTITGSTELQEKINDVIRKALKTSKRDADKLLTDTAKMRDKLRVEFGTDNIWSIKHVGGGLVDLEFICQYLILKHAPDQPKIITPNTLDQIAQLKAHKILPAKKAEILHDACAFLQDLQVILRLSMGSCANFTKQPQELTRTLCERFDAASLGQLETRLRRIQTKVTEAYQEIIAAPAEKIIVASSEDDGDQTQNSEG